ncbi:amidase domain-containing protein [Terrisporobacter glycolicus]|uniref:Putative amidase domain-containing protein n=1 Tax=Terrisporobacter petrolearius TaxID=1460447 RepID=A0ABZ3FAX3_9FIRM|nr:amidase domain-containing protein [Terrisporobacter glycolicus]
MFYEYDRIGATQYARGWALSRNPKFQDYEEWGGNCTNYISQCVNAGGIPMDPYGDNVMKEWYWYSDKKRTPSWTAAQPFFEYFTRNNNDNTNNFGVYATESNYEEMELGDIVQLIKDGKAYHTMIITGILFDGDEVYDYLISQNTYDLLDYPLSLKVGDRRYLKIFGYYM